MKVFQEEGFLYFIDNYFPFIKKVRFIISLALVKRTGGTKLEEKTMFSIRNMVFIFIASSVVLAILVYYLTGFPVLLLFLLLVLWKFIASSVSTMMLGLSGISTDVPYVKNLAIYASGYTRVDMWFVPSFDSAISGSGPAGIAFHVQSGKTYRDRLF